jgi:hypothetical protein
MLSLLSVHMDSALNVAAFTLKTSDVQLEKRVQEQTAKCHGQPSALFCGLQSSQMEIHLLLNCIEESGWTMLDNSIVFTTAFQTFVYTFRKQSSTGGKHEIEDR